MSRVLRSTRRALEALTGAQVREGEWHLVVLFFANLFFLVGAYYILKVIREPLILMEGGAVHRSNARALQAGLLLVLLPAYGYLSARFEPARLVKWVMGSCVLCVASFVALGQAGARVGFAFFVWLGLFSTIAVAQFWSLANDVLTEAEGQRLFPVIAVGGTLGGIGGAQLAARMLDGHPFTLMLVAAALLVSCALLSQMTHDAALAYRERNPHRQPWPLPPKGGLALVVHDRYLLLVACSVLILNFVNTTGDFLLAQLVAARAGAFQDELAERHYIARFYGDLQAYVALLAALVQTLLVARVFRKTPVASGLLVLPLLVVAGYGASAVFPVMSLVALVKVAQDSSEYSLNGTLQQALFLPTSRAAKYQAKAVIDTLVVRLGDLASAAVVLVGSTLGFGVRAYASVNVLAGLVWLLVIARLRTLALGAPRSRALGAHGEPGRS